MRIRRSLHASECCQGRPHSHPVRAGWAGPLRDNFTSKNYSRQYLSSTIPPATTTTSGPLIFDDDPVVFPSCHSERLQFDSIVQACQRLWEDADPSP
jgi:hypothetical protein